MHWGLSRGEACFITYIESLEKTKEMVELNIAVDEDEVQPAILAAISPAELEHVVKCTLDKAGITQAVTLSLLITSEETVQSLNKQYRQQDKPTDVLSFPLLDKPLVDAPAELLWMPLVATDEAEGNAFVTPPELTTNLGDIVISWPMVLRQAGEAGHSPRYELLYLLAHSTLHLIGYDDQSEAGYEAMVELQQAVMQTMAHPE